MLEKKVTCVKCNRRSTKRINKICLGCGKKLFVKGAKVKLHPLVLLYFGRSIPAHMGFTTEQFAWIDLLDNLVKTGAVGEIYRVAEFGAGRNVKFGETCIGIDYDKLELF